MSEMYRQNWSARASSTSLRLRRTNVGLFVRALGITWATIEIGMAKLFDNMRWLVFLQRLAAT